MDPRLEEQLGRLEVSFGASIARDEELAASDLAFSLRQDGSLTDLLQHGSFVAELADGSRMPIVGVGPDYFRVGSPNELLVTYSAVIVRRSRDGLRPTRFDEDLSTVLRRAARGSAKVLVDTPQGRISGRLTAARRDHLEVLTTSGEALIPLSRVRSISLQASGD